MNGEYRVVLLEFRLIEGCLQVRFTILEGKEEWGTGNREQGIGNREQGTGNREWGTGNGE